MPIRTSCELEQRAIDAIAAGVGTGEVAAIIGVSVRTMHAIRRRHGIAAIVGRPRIRPPRQKRWVISPLTEEQRAMVESSLKYADRIVRRMWRLRSRRYEDLEDYQSSARYALVRAAARFVDDGRASFRTMCRPFIEGEILRFINREMRANGYVWENWKQRRMVQCAVRVSEPEGDQ